MTYGPKMQEEKKKTGAVNFKKKTRSHIASSNSCLEWLTKHHSFMMHKRLSVTD